MRDHSQERSSPPHPLVSIIRNEAPAYIIYVCRAGWKATYDIRDALLEDIVGTGSAGSAGSDKICLVDGCYAIEVNGTNVAEDSVWSFATLSDGAPFGPARFVAVDGNISKSTACSSQDSNSTGISSKRSSSAKGVDGVLIGGIVAAIVCMVVVLGCCYGYCVFQNEVNTDCYRCNVVKKLKRTLGARIFVPVTATELGFQLSGQNKESAVSNEILSTAANQALAWSNDTERRSALRPALLGAKMTIQGLLAADSTTPVLEGVLCALQASLELVEALLHKANDILAAGGQSYLWSRCCRCSRTLQIA